jgi:CRP/FNR family transcriptional regulator, cyclic AMP receptor protein
MAHKPAKPRRDEGLLQMRHVASTSVRFEPAETIFAQGDRSATVMYIERGRVKLSVASPNGRTTVVAVLHAGSFFGEGALAGQRFRRSTAEAVTSTTIAVVTTRELRQRLHAERAFSDWFRSQLLARNIRIEQDLVANVFNGCESRLARALLLLAGADERPALRYPMPKISRDLLAEMTEMTRSRVDVLMNSFRKRGFLERHSERNGGLQVHRSLLNVVLHQ